MTNSPPFSRLTELDGGGKHVRCLYAPVYDATHLLTEAEAAAVSRAVPKRRNEYSTGRWLARLALGELDVPVTDLLSGARREPLWPAGVVGSIAHSERHALVLISRDPGIAGVGVDLETAGRLEQELVPKILTAREQAALHDTDPTLLFSAKEAAYKLLFPIVREYVDFLEVEVELDPGRGRFKLHYVGDKPACRCVEAAVGSYLSKGDGWLTSVILEKASGLATDQSASVSAGSSP